MNVHLISPDGRKTAGNGQKSHAGVFPPLGLMTVAGLTPPHINVTITDEALDVVDFDRPADIVGITVMTAAAPRAYEIADQFRERGVTVVMGGMHASALPNEALQHADAVVIAEAEGVWPQLLDDFEKGRMRSVYRNTEFPSLVSQPLPRRDLVSPRRYLGPNTLQASRGCPHNCSFCAVSPFFGRRHRTRPLDDVIAEAELLRGKALMFVDDNIMGNPTYARGLFDRLKDLKQDFFGQASTTMLQTPELITQAARAGCKGLFVGLETLSTANLADISKRCNVVSRYRELVSRLHDNGIAIVGSFIFGLDNDDEDVFERTAEFAEEAKIDIPQFSILTPLPGTRFFDEAESVGRIIERDWGKYDFKHVCYVPRRITAEKLEAGLRWVNRRCYSWRSIIKRTARRLQPLIWKVNGIYRYRVCGT